MPEAISIERSLFAVMNGKPIDDDQFNSLAINVFHHQFKHNAGYQQFCKKLSIVPGKISHWQDIPAVTTDVFKLANHPQVTFPLEKSQKTFLTSGTTAEVKGQHHFLSLSLYDLSITSAWQQLNLPQPRHALFLTPHPEHAPHSSLSHMMGVISKKLAEKSTWAINASGNLDIHAISRAATQDQPVALLGTALAFVHLFESIKTPLCLPPGSWAMETGGYKGTNRHMEKEQLYHLFEKNLHLSPDSIINEYSMTELSSQFYTRGLNQPHTGPSWTRIRVINPITNTDAQAGETGYLVIYDLANLHSAMAIHTQDLATRSEADLAQGNNSFMLVGRDPSALPRGCSRAADHRLDS